MDKPNLETLPSTYATCTLSDCPMATKCLRQMAFNELSSRLEHFRVVSPRLCSKNERCKHFRDSTPLTYARGFVNMQSKMYTGQYRLFVKMMMRRYARSTYFKMRSGKTPLSPKDQEYILNVLKKIGVTENMKFDSYEDFFTPTD